MVIIYTDSEAILLLLKKILDSHSQCTVSHTGNLKKLLNLIDKRHLICVDMFTHKVFTFTVSNMDKFGRELVLYSTSSTGSMMIGTGLASVLRGRERDWRRGEEREIER